MPKHSHRFCLPINAAACLLHIAHLQTGDKGMYSPLHPVPSLVIVRCRGLAG